MAATALSPKLSQKWGHLKYIKRRGRHQWSAACPVCGDRGPKTDRFCMWDDEPGARGWCRRCLHFEWADEEDYSRLTPEEMAAFRRQAEETRRRDEAVAKIRTKMLYHKRPWREWHDQMPEFARQLWREEGIDDWDQEDYCLGFIPDYKRWDRDAGREVKKSALTIPYLVHNKNHVRQIQYRLIVPDQFSRYYFESNIPAPLYLSQPLTPPQGHVLVVEGAKKCIVMNRLLGREFDRVVALPGSSWEELHFRELLPASSIIIMLDPDASLNAALLARQLTVAGTPSRWAQLPAKPDDMVVKYGVSKTEMMRYIRLAR